jgi:uncharacterized membrane protein YfcA
VEVTVSMFLILFTLAFICEYIDSSLGMGYGTILSPILIIMGFNPLIAVPAILLSQAFGGFSASMFHQRFENVTFNRKSADLKIALIVTGFGIFATIFAAIVAINIPKVAVKTYIGVLVLAMGIIIISNKKFVFTWKKIFGVGILGAFNKGLSGGGFGPVITGGQILSGHNHKRAIGVTTLAEVPICIVGFITFVIVRTIKEIEGPILSLPFSDFTKILFSEKMMQWELLVALILGSVLVTPFGAFTTKKLNAKYMHLILGIIITSLGIWTLVKTYT